MSFTCQTPIQHTTSVEVNEVFLGDDRFFNIKKILMTSYKVCLQQPLLEPENNPTIYQTGDITKLSFGCVFYCGGSPPLLCSKFDETNRQELCCSVILQPTAMMRHLSDTGGEWL